MRSVFILLFSLATTALPAENATIPQLVRKLGDESFVVRERAEKHLLRRGEAAFAELQRAKNDADPEIARRAERILSQLEQQALTRDNESVRYWTTNYELQTDPAEKAKIIWFLCNPLADYPDGEGLQALCRIARFDENEALRAEAVKGLIASPPVSPRLQQQWYRSLRDILHDVGDDELLQLLAAFVDLRCKMEERPPASDGAADESFQKQVRTLAERIGRFQTNPKYNAIRHGNRNDILLFYALAELQEGAGLTAERDHAVAAAAALPTEKATGTPGEDLLELGASRDFYDHLLVAKILRSKYRLAWAMRHFDLVINNADILFQTDACQWAAETCLFQKRFDESVRYYDEAIQRADSDEFKKRYNNSAERLRPLRVARLLVQGQQAAAANDWATVKERTDAALLLDPYEVDVLILAWQWGRRPEADNRYHQAIERKIDDACQHIERQIHREGHAELRRSKTIESCNQAAWLVANTGGDFSVALKLIEEALKTAPDSAAYLDTLGHVYFLGKQYEKAVQTQEKVVRLAPECVLFRDALARFRAKMLTTRN